MLLLLIAALLAQFQISAQTITGPAEVCPNITVRYEFSGCPDGAVLEMIGQPEAATIIARTSTYIDVQFPDYSGTNFFTLQATPSCGNGSFPRKDIRVKSIGPSGSSNLAVPCGHIGYYTFYQNFSTFASSATATSTTSWPLYNTYWESILGKSRFNAIYNVNNYNGGEVKMTVQSVCANVAPITWTINVTRAAANDLTYAVWTTPPANFCTGGSTTAAVQAYTGAISYTWTSDQPSLKINGQSSPVTTISSSVTLTETANAYTANLSVKANVPCGSSSPISRSFVVNAGVPDLATVMLTNSLGQGGFACYTDPFNTASPIMSPGSNYDLLQVEVVPPAGATSNFTTTQDFVVPVRRAGWHTMSVTPVNGCGTGNTIVYEFEAIDCTQSLQRAARTDKEKPTDHANTLLSISPNPAQNQVTIRFEQYLQKELTTAGITEVRILDLSGRIKITKKTPAKNNTLQLDVQALPSGIYVVEIIQRGRSRTSKLVITR